MLLYPGVHQLRIDPKVGGSNILWAAVSASAPSFVKVWLDGALVEDIWVGPPHTWWENNSLLGRKVMTIDSVLKVEVGPNAILRIEGTLIES